MSEVIGIELVGLKRLQATLDRISPAVQDQLRIFMARFGLLLRDQVKTNIVERFKSGLGPLQQGVKLQHIEEVGSVTERVYIDDVPYAAIQEYGGKTPPHVIEAVNGKALAFMMGGPLGFSSGGGVTALVFAKKVNHPGSLIPERSYARLALVQMRAPFENGIRETVSEAVDQSFAVAAE
jgi:hypothetical protein